MKAAALREYGTVRVEDIDVPEPPATGRPRPGVLAELYMETVGRALSDVH
jgi:hypothetical protein